MTSITIRDVRHDLMRWAFPGTTWNAWDAFLAAMYGLPMTESQHLISANATGRTDLPCAPFGEAFCIGGRRSGKSRVTAAIAVFEAFFGGHERHLAPGERGVVLNVAQDRAGSQMVFQYIVGLIHGTTEFAAHIAAERAESLDLDNGITVEVGTPDHVAIRGRTVVCLIADELAFMGAGADDLLAAARAGMATIPGAKLLAITSPWARRGPAWDAFRQHHGRDGAPVLVWCAPTTVMNPSPEVAAHIARAYERDPLSAATEFGAAFRTDVSAALPDELIDAAVDSSVLLREPLLAPGTGQRYRYYSYADPAGGAGADAFTGSVAHVERGVAILDATLEVRPPFSTANATTQLAALFKRYGTTSITGDRFGGDWPTQEFAKHGITYTPAELTRSELYVEAVPLFSSGRVRLLDQPRLLAQLKALERRAARGGREIIDHPPGGHDDLSNAACGALVLAAARPADSNLLHVVYSDLSLDMARELGFSHFQRGGY